MFDIFLFSLFVIGLSITEILFQLRYPPILWRTAAVVGSFLLAGGLLNGIGTDGLVITARVFGYAAILLSLTGGINYVEYHLRLIIRRHPVYSPPWFMGIGCGYVGLLLTSVFFLYWVIFTTTP